MNFINRSILFVLLLALTLSFISYNNSYAGGSASILPLSETDTNNYQLYSFYDLRDRESFVQVTSPDSPATLHVQVFDVGNLCNENNFFDTYTTADTHVYNLRDILTNDGDPSGFVLPDGAYGFVVITVVLGEGQPANTGGNIIGNFRVIDNSGYEYRTNSQGPSLIQQIANGQNYTFNFNTLGGVNASDVIGITVNDINSGEVTASGSSLTFDTTLFNNSEVEFSCSDTNFSCTADTFEYGINDAIPNSRDGSVVCGSNVISEGLVSLNRLSESNIDAFAGYVGLNNGNGRGSMDSFHQDRGELNCQDRGVCRVFATFGFRQGNFGGINDADSFCQNSANSSPLTQGGTYLTWLSTTNPDISPNTRFHQVTVPYQLLDGTPIADNYSDLISGSIDNPINRDEFDNFVVINSIWTGTDEFGNPLASNCNNWTTNLIDVMGGIGTVGQSDSNWSNFVNATCDNPYKFYCFEQ